MCDFRKQLTFGECNLVSRFHTSAHIPFLNHCQKHYFRSAAATKIKSGWKYLCLESILWQQGIKELKSRSSFFTAEFAWRMWVPIFLDEKSVLRIEYHTELTSSTSHHSFATDLHGISIQGPAEKDGDDATTISRQSLLLHDSNFIRIITMQWNVDFSFMNKCQEFSCYYLKTYYF